MPHDVRIAISCPDRTGLLSAVAGRLFDLGGDLGDTTFAVLGEGAEFTAVASLPDGLTAAEAQEELTALTELAGASVSVTDLSLGALHGESGRVTHRVEVRGADRPGLVARLAEVFSDYGANIVRMDTERLPHGREGEYLIQFEVWVPADRADACLAAVGNTAQALGLVSEGHALVTAR